MQNCNIRLGFWIAAPGKKRGYEVDIRENAPVFRREFEVSNSFQNGRILICGLGFMNYISTDTRLEIVCLIRFQATI